MSHRHEAESNGSQRIIVRAVALTLGIFVLEAIAGLYANSLALVADAGHMLTDSLAFGLTWFALRRAQRPADARYTFGYQRSGILAALTNAVFLILIAVGVAIAAAMRLEHPPHVQGAPVIGVAIVATAANVFLGLRLHPHSHDNLNVRAALFHVVGDTLASAGVAVGGIIILTTGWNPIDPILSLAICVLIGVSAWRIVVHASTVLMEATPRGLDVSQVVEAMMSVPGVEDVHDLHVWALADGYRLLSAHVCAPDQRIVDAAALLADLKTTLAKQFGITHSTIEIECVGQSPVVRPIEFRERP